MITIKKTNHRAYAGESSTTTEINLDMKKVEATLGMICKYFNLNPYAQYREAKDC